jgi:hypothetical protein
MTISDLAPKCIVVLLLVLAPTLCQSSTARAGEPENGPIEDTLPKGALLRLGTDRTAYRDFHVREGMQPQQKPHGYV